MPATPQPVLSTGLLMPGDRVARSSVPVWAARLRKRVAQVSAGVRRTWDLAEGVGRVANNAALIAALQGNVDRAASLCRAQIRWQDRTSRRAGNTRIARLGVQPWVNLGRLQAQAGDWEGALERFARLAYPGADGWLCLGTLRVPPTGAEGAPEGFDGFLHSAYVADSLKALLINGRYAETMAFAARQAADHGDNPVLHEARVVAAGRQGESDAAAALAREGRTRWRGWARAVFSVRLAEVLACAGQREEACSELARVAATFGSLSHKVRSRLEHLFIIVRAAQTCAELGMREEAAGLASAAAEGALVAEDEILRIESLRVVCAARPGEDTAAWRTLEALQTGTGYARYRRNAQPPMHDEEADQLFEELDVLFAD
ncbi:hypothetical protein [Longimicrobium sp.]|uniref:hypothetical protein n=1 Tax=Longimicrobium sp. TaxID=2029185 RepID=UPI003B3A51FE